MASPLELSYIELQSAQGIESVKLQPNGSEYSITQGQEKSDTVSKAFDKPLSVSFQLRVNPTSQVTVPSAPANPVPSQSTTEQPIAGRSTSANTAPSAGTRIADKPYSGHGIYEFNLSGEPSIASASGSCRGTTNVAYIEGSVINCRRKAENTRDCPRVIHNDIVAVWNFYDPCQYLNSEEFREVMMNMVARVDAPAEPNSLHRTDTLTEEVPLIALAPVMLPLNAFFGLGKWVLATYQRLQDVPTKFMAYIADLTHVLEILFSFTAGMKEKKLTRMAIKLAYKAYLESQWVMYTHTEIRHFRCWAAARDVVLEKITTMIPSEDREDRVSRALERMPSVELERDEQWTSEEISW
ncbi:hypothetical protein F5J12DRAFT_897621 [Pisolithus orientalis]|uniref:uncharacterized protein n=1 Tax=Pisolithus orientalis TaxID=936130 RepID=UPI002223FA6E|nr:uncharacterized protein F5J12DRAFT_897621 [Pisolithus orientalis]KAI5990830.1 hypothetical protein F5J12DRAFT_897621 [Pisolithus orientalis]